MSVLSIQPARAPLDATLTLTGSKSLCNRALIAAGLAQGSTVISNFLWCDDTRRMIEGLQALGLSVASDRHERRIEIRGCSGYLPETEATIDCGESGTMLRFLTAVCATGTGRYELHGSGRLHQRPLQPLIEALRYLGGRFEFKEREGFAPLVVHGRGLGAGTIQVDGSQSSQFASAVLLVSPLARGDVMMSIVGDAVSRPYVALTLAVMDHFNVAQVTEDQRRIIVPAPQAYLARNYEVEPDASTAGYFLAAAALCGGRVAIEGLGRASAQGDVRLADVLDIMGCEVSIEERRIVVEHDPTSSRLRGLDQDLGDTPDLVPTIAVLAVCSAGPSVLRHVAHLRLKESDRLAALCSELQKAGARLQVQGRDLHIEPPEQPLPATFCSFGDHRLAMACGLLGLVVPGVCIEGAGCVGKSYPDYFSVLKSLSSER